MTERPVYPLYNSTFTLFRASPFYVGPTSILDPTSLRAQSRRLRDVLKGDNLRGVHLEAQNDPIGTLGPLEECTWQLFGSEKAWDRAHDPEALEDSNMGGAQESPEIDASNARGIHIQLHYANATHTALLLRDAVSTPPSEEFISFPLVLLRMPQFLRDAFVAHLSNTFDSRMSLLKPRSAFILNSLEHHLECTLETTSASSDLPNSFKSLQISLSFPHITPTLRNLDISIPREDVPSFLQRGRAIISQRGIDPAIRASTPFTAALAVYLSEHLALTPSALQAHVSRAACGSFAVATDGKLKIFSSGVEPGAEDHVDTFMAQLIREASLRMGFEDADPLGEGSDEVTMTSISAKEAKSQKGKRRETSRHETRGGEEEADEDVDEVDRTERRKGRRAATATPLDPPPPYQLVDPATAGR